jgi:hypothetical protein
MKNVQQNLKSWPGILAIMCLFSLAISSCIKNNSDNNTPQQPISALEVINASPDAGPVDFFINADLVNSSGLATGQYINYFNVYSGIKTATFFQQGTSTTIVRDTINFVANKTYSLFLANLRATPDAFLLADSANSPAGSTAAIRLVNASPDAGAVDLVINSGTATASNVIYKKASLFLPINITGVSDTLKVTKAGTNIVLATAPIISLQSGAIYTVWLSGLANTSIVTDKLAANIMANATFN